MDEIFSFNVRLNFVTRLVDIKASEIQDISKIVEKSKYKFKFESVFFKLNAFRFQCLLHSKLIRKTTLRSNLQTIIMPQ